MHTREEFLEGSTQELQVVLFEQEEHTAKQAKKKIIFMIFHKILFKFIKVNTLTNSICIIVGRRRTSTSIGRVFRNIGTGITSTTIRTCSTNSQTSYLLV